MESPDKWKNGSGFPTRTGEQDIKQWWSAFGDTQLTHLIRLSQQNHPNFASAAAAVREAQAKRQEQRSSLLPSANYIAGSNSNKTWNRGAPDNSSTNYSSGLSASWELDLFGKNRLSLRASDAETQAAVADMNSTQASLASETALAYLDWQAARMSLDILKRSISHQTETTQIARWRYQAGQTDKLELDQSEATLNQTMASLTTSEKLLAQYANQLNLLCGATPGTLSLKMTATLAEPSSRLAVGIPADTLRQRPDVRAAYARWTAAISRTDAAKREQLPSFSLTGTLGINAASASKMFSLDSVTSNVISGLSGPIFNAGAIRSRIDQKDAAEEQTFQKLRLTVLTALSEVEDALIACNLSGNQISHLRMASASADSAAILASQKYDTGVIDMTTVLSAQRSGLEAESRLLIARLDRSKAYVELYRALGGGY